MPYYGHVLFYFKIIIFFKKYFTNIILYDKFDHSSSHFLDFDIEKILGGVIFMLIQLENVSKTFKVAERGSTFREVLLSFIRRRYKEVHALKKVSFNINEGEIVRIHRSEWSTVNPQQSK